MMVLVVFLVVAIVIFLIFVLFIMPAVVFVFVAMGSMIFVFFMRVMLCMPSCVFRIAFVYVFYKIEHTVSKISGNKGSLKVF